LLTCRAFDTTWVYPLQPDRERYHPRTNPQRARPRALILPTSRPIGPIHPSIAFRVFLHDQMPPSTESAFADVAECQAADFLDYAAAPRRLRSINSFWDSL